MSNRFNPLAFPASFDAAPERTAKDWGFLLPARRELGEEPPTDATIRDDELGRARSSEHSSADMSACGDDVGALGREPGELHFLSDRGSIEEGHGRVYLALREAQAVHHGGVVGIDLSCNRAQRRHRSGDPHDRVAVRGAVRRLSAPLYHYNYRDLRHHLEKVNAYTSIMAEEMAARGVRFRWRDVLLRPPARFLKMLVLRRGFLDGWRGLVVASIGAFYVFLKYCKLWEREQAASTGEAGGPPETPGRAGPPDAISPSA